MKSVRQLSCVSQDTEPPDSATISRKGTSVGTNSTSTIHEGCIARNQGTSQRCPYAMKFEDRSPGETARQERCARGDRWNLPRTSFSSKKIEDKAAFYSLAEEWILPDASTINSDETESLQWIPGP